MDSSPTTSLKAREPTPGLVEEHTTANGLKGRCTDTVSLPGHRANGTKVTTRTTENVGSGGTTVNRRSMKDTGRKGNPRARGR